MGAESRIPRDRRRSRPTRAGTILSDQLIVETAIRLMGQHGAAALTVRRLGAALGADPSSIYRYFRSTDDLMLAVADELIGRSLAGFEPSADWRLTLRDLGLRLHAVSLAHPHVAVLSATRVTRRPHEIRTVELGLGALRSAGFEPDAAAHHYHCFVDLVLGFAALDAGFETLPPEAARADDEAWASTYGRLPAERFPHIAACARGLQRSMAVSAFPSTLDLFLGALAELAPVD
ncbi:TetR/AcrR family transcriptional regulator [Kitasatospora sp. NPDC052896]|uniref:TetR/AcrR family transcriptional regulator n=1 Tax=Kitasatospora sp. NPDC052896 TaxID=3364061 RepID=UPI0037C5A356